MNLVGARAQAPARLALVHEVGVHAAARRVLQDRLEDGLQVRERLDLRHEVHQVRILFCKNDEGIVNNRSMTFSQMRLLNNPAVKGSKF